MSKPVRIVNPDDQELEFDNLYPAVVVQDLDHHRLHEGAHFSFTDHATGVTARNFYIQVPATSAHHVVATVEASDAWTMNIFEGGSVGASGVAVSVYNDNRNSTKVSGMTVSHTPAAPVTGAVILKRFVITSASGPFDAGGASRADRELILKNSTNYLFMGSGSSSTVHTEVSWYETEDVS